MQDKKMLGFFKRTTSGIHVKRVQKILYFIIVRSQLAYSSQVYQQHPND
jgi:hypothetical protein